MVYYAAFCIAQYAGSHERLSKPFNPILGETFEFATPKWKFIAEQVSHHPPISACHVIHEDYSFWTNTHVKSKFWGKSIEFKPLGVTKFKINSTEEVLTCTRPSTYLHGFLIGHKYLDHNGEMKITMDSPSSSETPSVKIKFHKLGLFANLQKIGKISGEVYDSLGRKVYEIFGNCTREINYKSVKSDCDSTKLWEFPQQPKNWDENYRFTDFTLKLNMLTEEMKEHLPPTDSRFRLDQAYLEKGDLEKAGEEKFRLEEKQRRRRKRHQKEKFIPKPLYFVEDPDSVNDDFASYIYKGGYWNQKNTQKWDHLPDLFGPDSLEL
mmetsp:Transcript_23019/g.22875  ORF Transcript_23019/g.22875 Transcript_23019/m.22875 type:complete len:323 (-) Transcript_23019:8-976(-)